ncbi:TetR/AcrR family transcriptional regulator [Pseudofrankia inefficax]|uniref:Regulatory protein TetR n=1 Tax=Pseudofrankia inefficax (strain DSM 45817 / CECT 9037 / DDB 130130 / EuI1c) TaxID=298654 RepID=E3JAP2_PSEI1|nr:TetR/AcrR family transcriptional regulator [Pseudofrankia inefficax]ADP82234.1 regulatory protein TetR [Pseudofrankia inefficax]
MTATQTARELARAELTRQIKETARRHLATSGAAALSLRAVARELGMTSSAVYRYFPSRDELLTVLIIEAYDALGARAEQADDAVPPSAFLSRWHAVCGAVREWAAEHPHEYALLYGSPVPGYRAPRDTTGPAARVVTRLALIVGAGWRAGQVVRPRDEQTSPDWSLRRAGRAEDDLRRLAGTLDLGDLPVEVLLRAVAAWSQLFGFISLESFGQMANAINDPDAVFEQTTRAMARLVGFRGDAPPSA